MMVAKTNQAWYLIKGNKVMRRWYIRKRRVLVNLEVIVIITNMLSGKYSWDLELVSTFEDKYNIKIKYIFLKKKFL